MKADKQQLLEEVSEFLAAYLKSGRFGFASFIKKLNLNINNIEQLLRIHFILKPEIKRFAQELPNRIRKFKTSTIVKNEILTGLVKGQINWTKTINHRLNTNPKDRTTFSCNEKYRNYTIKENLVLKEVIDIIYSILNEISWDKVSKYSWMNEWLVIKPQFETLYLKNVYLKRINNKGLFATDRMILEVLNHRNPLYREAAELLLSYRKIMNYKLNQKEVTKLLADTFISPNKEEVLFELYWVIKMIKSNTKDAELNIIDGKNQIVASWITDNYKYDIYHDSTGSNDLKFLVKWDEVQYSNNEYLNRKVLSMQDSKRLAESYFNFSLHDSMWSGRPDFLVEVREIHSNNMVKIVIGEVKYTKNRDYAVQGMRELIDYIWLIKDREMNYINHGDYSQVQIKGILCLDDIPIQKSHSKEQSISVVTINDVNDYLKIT
jgi:hypothetical protein